MAEQSNETEASKGSVLLVDDESLMLRGYTRVLQQAGYQVQSAGNGDEAIGLIETNDFDVIVSDIRMPGMDGVQFLRTIRERDFDLPVILITGRPSVESAIQAVEFRAFRYLLKPFEAEELRKVLAQAVGMRRLARIKREAAAYLRTGDIRMDEEAQLDSDLTSSLSDALMVYQPIVSCSGKSVAGYEALIRSKGALSNPAAILEAAEKLDAMHRVGRRVREIVARDFASAPLLDIYVNLHPQDLMDEELFSETGPLAPMADRLVLEITEREALDSVRDVRRRVIQLREMGFRIAIDDLGAGYAALSGLAQLEPDIVKIDMSLVRDVHIEPVKQKLISSMIQLFADMDVAVILEGVETAAERDTLLDIGGDLMQGYFFAKPGMPLPEVTWD